MKFIAITLAASLVAVIPAAGHAARPGLLCEHSGGRAISNLALRSHWAAALRPNSGRSNGSRVVPKAASLRSLSARFVRTRQYE